MLHSVFADLFFTNLGLHGISRELVFLLHDLADVEDKFFFDGIRVFTDFERRRHQLILCELHA